MARQNTMYLDMLFSVTNVSVVIKSEQCIKMIAECRVIVPGLSLRNVIVVGNFRLKGLYIYRRSLQPQALGTRLEKYKFAFHTCMI